MNQAKSAWNRMLLACGTLAAQIRKDLRELDVWPDKSGPVRRLFDSIVGLEHAIAEMRNQSSGATGPVTRSRAQAILSQTFREAVAHGASHSMAPPSGEQPFTFDSSVFSVSEVLHFLGINLKTGVVRIATEKEMFQIELSRGDVVNAFSNNSPPGMRLGEILVAQGAISEERLQQFLELHRGSPRRLGEALANAELVSHEDLLGGIRYQINQLFARCLSAPNAAVEFAPKDEATMERELRVNLTDALLEGHVLSDDAFREVSPT